MNITSDSILQVLYESVRELNEQRSSEQQLKCSPETRLADTETLDSLGFVTLVTLVEEKCSRRFGTDMVLSAVGTYARDPDPFHTIRSLADFIALVLKERVALWH